MTLPRQVKAVVFDMDGLLVDTETVYSQAIMGTAQEQGHDFPVVLFHRMIGSNDQDSRRILLEHFGQDFDFEGFWKLTSQRFYELAAGGIALKAGVLEILDALDRLGLPYAVAISSPHHSVEHSLSRHGLPPRFHTIVARGDYARGKPAPDPYLVAAERLGVAPADCLGLEDSYNGVRAAHAAGMMTVMVPDVLAATEEMQSLCVRIARDLHEVRELLELQHVQRD